MKRCGPPLKDRREKRFTERGARTKFDADYYEYRYGIISWQCDGCGYYFAEQDDDGTLCHECKETG